MRCHTTWECLQTVHQLLSLANFCVPPLPCPPLPSPHLAATWRGGSSVHHCLRVAWLGQRRSWVTMLGCGEVTSEVARRKRGKANPRRHSPAAVWVTAPLILLLAQFLSVPLATAKSSARPLSGTGTDVSGEQSDCWHLSANPFPSSTPEKVSASLYQRALC